MASSMRNMQGVGSIYTAAPKIPDPAPFVNETAETQTLMVEQETTQLVESDPLATEAVQQETINAGASVDIAAKKKKSSKKKKEDNAAPPVQNAQDTLPEALVPEVVPVIEEVTSVKKKEKREKKR
jgi:ATP adenylyltransferase/5',5'''-P-1,P-4-tetraphosphate phosphorylase II